MLHSPSSLGGHHIGRGHHVAMAMASIVQICVMFTLCVCHVYVIMAGGRLFVYLYVCLCVYICPVIVCMKR